MRARDTAAAGAPIIGAIAIEVTQEAPEPRPVDSGHRHAVEGVHGDPADVHERHAHSRARRRVRALPRHGPRRRARPPPPPDRRRRARRGLGVRARGPEPGRRDREPRARGARRTGARGRRRRGRGSGSGARCRSPTACRLLRAAAGAIRERVLEMAAVVALRDRQVPRRVDRRGRGGRRPDRDLLRADRGARRVRGPARHALAGRAQPQRPAPVRRVRGHRAVQLPGRARDRHERGGARRRQHRRDQALRARAVVRRARRRHVRSGRAPGGRRERRPRRAGDRHRARHERDRRGRLHRLGRGRPRARPQLPGGRVRTPGHRRDGRQDPAIVTAAADLDAAAEGIVASAFGFSGQKCSACSRAIVLDAVHDGLVERLRERTEQLAVGDPATPTSTPAR